jgi:hypothetical protein
MNVDYIFFFLLGIAMFGAAIGIGWNMRGSVKEEELYKYKSLSDELERLRWKMNEILDEVSK